MTKIDAVSFEMSEALFGMLSCLSFFNELKRAHFLSVFTGEPSLSDGVPVFACEWVFSLAEITRFFGKFLMQIFHECSSLQKS
jgi:hypothetical protein